MSLYTRHQRIAMGPRERTKIHKHEGLSLILYDSPLSTLFRSPVTKPDTKAIKTYLISVQVKRYGRAVDLPEAALLAHIKRALSEHSPEYLCRAIRWASFISCYPFSLGFALRAFKDVGGQFDIRLGKNQESSHSSDGAVPVLF